MVLGRMSARHKTISCVALGMLGLATTIAAAAVPITVPSMTEFKTEQAAPPALPTLTSDRGIALERAFGPEDEDCMVEIQTVGSGLGLRQIKALACGG